MMYRLLALDIDGTLLNSRKELTHATEVALLEAQKQGTKVVLCSGRPLYGIKPLVKQLQLAHYGGFVIGFNGGLIYDCQTSKPLYEQLLEPSCYPYIYNKVISYGLNLVSYWEDHILTESIDDDALKYIARINRMKILLVDDFLEFVDYAEPKLVVTGDELKLPILERELQDHYADRLSIYRSDSFLLEIMPRGINKANGLKRLLKHLGIPRKQLIACGDGYNDQSMIEFAGLGVAMANAKEPVLKVADYITASNDDDGIAKVIQKYIFA